MRRYAVNTSKTHHDGIVPSQARQMKRSPFSFFFYISLFATATVMCQPRVHAATISWSNTAGGNWSTGANWTGGVAPTAADVAVISANGTYTVVLDVSPTVVGLTLGGGSGVQTLSLPSGITLTVNGDINIAGSGALSWTGGTLTGSGATTIASGAAVNISGTSAKTLNRDVSNSGTITWTGASDITTGGTFTLTNQSGGLFDAQNDQTCSVSTIINAGTFRKSLSFGTTTFSGSSFVNTGTLNIQTGTFACSASYTNSSGTINCPSGTINLTGTYSFSNGTVQAGTINLSGLTGTTGGAVSLSSGVVVNQTAGTNTLSSGAIISGAGKYQENGGTLSNNGTVNVANLDLISGTASGVTGSDVLTITGTMNWTGGTLSTGQVTINSSAALNISANNAKTLNRNIVNNGTITWSGSGDINGGGGNSISNQSGAIFESQNDQTLTIGSFINAGTLRKLSSTGTTVLATILTNTGTINFQTGALQINGALNSSGGGSSITSGTVSVAYSTAGSSSGTLSLSSGVVFNHTSGTHALNSGMTVSGAGVYQVNGGTLTNTGTVSVSNLTFASGTVSGATSSDVLTITGTLNWTGGTLSTGQVTINLGGALNFSGNNAKTLNRNIVNSGTITWSGSGDINGNAANSINNQSGGIFDIQNDQTLTIGSLTNAGTFRKTSGSGVTTVSAIMANSGTVSFQTGSLSISGSFNSSGGSSNISAGTVNVAYTTAGSSSGTLTLASGVLLNHNSGTHNLASGMSVAGAGAYQVNGGTLNNTGTAAVSLLNLSSGTVSGTSGSDVLVVAGTMNWTGGAISTGQVTVNSGSTLSISGSGTKTMNRDISNSGTTTWTGSGNISGSGSFANQASGSFNAQTTASMAVTAVSNAGIINIGASPSTTNITGNYTNTGTLNIELGGTTAGTQYDVLNITGAATLGGTLNLTLINGFTPSLANAFQIINYTSRTGAFSTINGQSVAGGLFLRPDYNATNLTLTTVSQSQADLMIRNSGGPTFFTDNTYETTAPPATQTRTQSVNPGAPAVYEMQLQNDGAVTTSYTLTQSLSGTTSGFTVQYFNAFTGGTDITSQVTGGTASFNLAAGAIQQVRMVVTPSAIPNSPAGGSSLNVDAILTGGGTTDIVRATTTVNGVNQGDAMIRNNGEVPYLTDNTYETTPVVQVRSQSVNPGVAATYDLRIQNDGNQTAAYTVTGTAGTSSFGVVYTDLQTSQNVTSQVTGGGYTFASNPIPGETRDLRLTVTPTAVPGSPAGGTSFAVNTTVSGGSTDTVLATTTVNPVDQPDNMIKNQGEAVGLFLTGDLYETSPALQVKSQSVAPGSSATYDFRIQNDGNRTANYRINGDGSSSGFVVTYFDAASGGTDVTSAITGVGLTYSLAAGATQDLRVVVTPNAAPNSPAGGSAKTVNITLTGGSNTDVVRANTTVTTFDRGDLMIRNQGDSSYLTDDVYETTAPPVVQVKTQTANPGSPATYELLLQNDGNQTNSYTLQETARTGSGYTVAYFDALSGGNNITSLVTGSGITYSMAAGSSLPVRLVVTPNAVPNSPAPTSPLSVTVTLTGGGTTDRVLATTATATAGQSDLMARNSGEGTADYRYANIYEATPSTQVKAQSVAPGVTATYEVLLQNDGNTSQQINVTGTGSGNSFTVLYFDAFTGGNPITTAVTGSGNGFTLAPGATQEIRVQVTPAANPSAPASGSSRIVTINATPPSGGTDSVQLTTTVTTQDTADLMIRNNGETTYLSDNVYEATPATQIKSQSVSPGAIATYEMLLQNDGNSAINYTLTGTGSGTNTGFTVMYFNALSGGSEITSGVTGSGQVFTIASGASQPVRVEVTPTALPFSPAGGSLYPVTVVLTDGTSMDSVRANTTALAGDQADIMIRNNGDATYLTNNLYETTPVAQLKAQTVSPGSSVTYEIETQNDGNQTQTYTLTGSASSSGFSVKYFDSLIAGNDVTASVTGAGLSVSLIAGEARQYHVVVTPDPFPNSPLAGARKDVTMTFTGGGTTDAVLASTTVVNLDQIDAMIRNQGETDADYSFNNTYESTPVAQIKSQSTTPGTKVSYEIKLENEGDRARDYTITGTADSTGWTVRYYDALSGGNDISQAVNEGTKVFTIPPNASQLMRIEVTPDAVPNSPAGGSTKEVTVTTTGATGGKDAVNAVTTVTNVDQVDLQVRNFGQAAFAGDNVYEAGTPVVQLLAQSVSAGTTATYEMKLQNDGNQTIDMLVTGTAKSTGFDVKYFDAQSGDNDITADITGSGKSFNLAAGATADLRAEVTPNEVPNSPAANSTKPLTIAVAGGGTFDRAQFTTTTSATDQADGMIRNSDETQDADYKSDNVYETTPTAQVKSQTVKPGVTAVYELKLQNDGNQTQTYWVTGPASVTGWTVQYFDALSGGNDITSSVTGSGKTFPLTVSESNTFRVEVTPSSVPASPPAAATQDVIVTFYVPDLNGQKTAVDTVKAATTVTTEDQSDLMIRSKGDATYLTDNLYEGTPVVQIKSQTINVGATAVYELKLQNDGNRSHDFTLVGEAGDTNWSVKYFDELNLGNDISSAVTGSGKTITLASGETKELRLEVTAKTAPNAPLANAIRAITVSLIGSTVDVVKAVTTSNPYDQADAMLRNKGGSAFTGSDVYETTPNTQVVSQQVNPGSSVTYEIRIQNDGNRTQSFTVTGSASSDGFTLQYYDSLQGSTEVTPSVIGSGLTYSLGVGEYRDLTLIVNAAAAFNGPLSGAVKSATVTLSGGGTNDVVRADTTVIAKDQVDAMIRNKGETDADYKSPNVYESTPITQIKTQSVNAGVAATYEVKVENDGNEAHDYVLKGTGDSTGWTVRYYDALSGGTDITGLITGSGKTISLTPGASQSLRFEVTPAALPNSPASGSTKDVIVTASGTVDDSVKATTTVGTTDQADIMVRNQGETAYLTNDIYETGNPTVQVKSQTVGAGVSAVYEVQIQNDGNRTLEFVLTGDGSGSGFNVVYYDALTGGTDITAAVTTTGKSFGLAAGESRQLRLEVTPNSFPNSPASGTSKTVVLSVTGGGSTDKALTTTTASPSSQADGMIRNAGESDAEYLTNDLYETTPSVQVKSQTTSPGIAATYEMKVQNDGNLPQTIAATGTGNSTGWTVTYYDAHTGGSDITSVVTGSGKSFALASGAVQLLRVAVKPSSTLPTITTKEVTVTFAVLDANGQKTSIDTVKAATTVSTNIVSVNIGVGNSQVSLVSLPDVAADFDPFSGLLNQNRDSFLVRWNPQKNNDSTYAKYEYLVFGGSTQRPDLAFTQVENGRGYWRRASSTFTGQFVSRAVDFDLPIYAGNNPFKGWNLIGVPYTSPVDMSSLQVVTGGTTYTLYDAALAGITDSFAWKFADPAKGYELVAIPEANFDNAGTALEPGLGYWFFTNQTATLRYTAPTSLRSAKSTTSSTASRRRRDGWMVQLRARCGGLSDSYNYFGTSRLPRRLPKPPIPPKGGFVSVSFVDRLPAASDGPRGTRLAAILNQPEADSMTWDFNVETNLSQEVELSWPDFTQVPKDINLYLDDLVSNRRLYMRTQLGYHFRGVAGSTHPFRIVAERRRNANLVISGLSVRNNGLRGAASSQLTFVLSEAADVQVRMLSLSGRLVNQFPSPNCRAGLNSLVLSHTNRQGFVLPRGAYLCEVTAVTPEGQAVTGVRTLQVK